MNRRQCRATIAENVRYEPFERGPVPGVLASDGWLAEVRGEVLHLAIRNVPNTGISWPDKQWIKDQIAGRERVAIEVFPPADDVVDAANMYHLWVLPRGMTLPFGLHLGVRPQKEAA